jgi:hypothetical protein
VAIHYTGEVFREAGEGWFHCQSKHTSRELVEDAAAIVFDFFTYQRLVYCSLGLEFAEESGRVHGVSSLPGRWLGPWSLSHNTRSGLSCCDMGKMATFCRHWLN